MLSKIGFTFSKPNKFFNSLPRETLATIASLICLTILGVGLLFDAALMVQLMLLVAFGIPGVVLVWHRPEFGLIGLLFLTSGFLRPDTLEIRLPVGGLELRDLVLLGLLGLLGLREAVFRSFKIPWVKVSLPFVIFMGIVMISAVNSLFFLGVARNWALNDLRTFMYYLTFFLAAWGIENNSQVRWLLIGSFIIADITAGIVIIQQFLGGDNLLLEGMAFGLWEVWDQGGGIVRVVPPGLNIMYFMLIFSLSLAFFKRDDKKLSLFLLVQFLMLSIGVLLTFTRSAWGATGIACVFMAIVTFPEYKKYIPALSGYAVGSLMFFGGLLGILMAGATVEIPVVTSIVDRFATLLEPEDTVESLSLQWRLFELEQSTAAIKESPILGVSLGNTYRNVTVYQGEAVGLWTDGDLSSDSITRFTRYVHSSYLSIGVKLGIPGLVAFFWLVAAFLINGFTQYLKLEDPWHKAITLGAIGGLIGLLQWSIFHSQLVETANTVVVGLVMGLVAAVLSIHNQTQAQEAEQDV